MQKRAPVIPVNLIGSKVIIALGLPVLAALTACQTNRLKEISGIENGMTKSEVLERAGGPQRTDRKHDKDVWTYIVPEERRDVLKEVDFTEGRVIYVGDPIAPPGPSAEEQDRLNEESNAKSEAERRRDQLLQDIGSSKPHHQNAGGGSFNAASVDANVEDEPAPQPTPKPVFIPLGGSSD